MDTTNRRISLKIKMKYADLEIEPIIQMIKIKMMNGHCLNTR